MASRSLKVPLFSMIAMATAMQLSGCSESITATYRTLEYRCIAAENCKPESGHGFELTKRLTFRINLTTNAVSVEEVNLKIANSERATARFLEKCSVVDGETWHCDDKVFGYVRVQNGKFYRHQPLDLESPMHFGPSHFGASRWATYWLQTIGAVQ